MVPARSLGSRLPFVTQISPVTCNLGCSFLPPNTVRGFESRASCRRCENDPSYMSSTTVFLKTGIMVLRWDYLLEVYKLIVLILERTGKTKKHHAKRSQCYFSYKALQEFHKINPEVEKQGNVPMGRRAVHDRDIEGETAGQVGRLAGKGISLMTWIRGSSTSSNDFSHM